MSTEEGALEVLGGGEAKVLHILVEERRDVETKQSS
jgi:hypothetical protein